MSRAPRKFIGTYILTSAPPSLNNAFVNVGRGRKKSAAYKAWLRGAGWELKAQGVMPGKVPVVSGPYGLDITLGRALTRADVDNLIKPISDLLVKMGATDDDRRMDEVSIRFSDVPHVSVRVYSTVREAA